MSSLNISTDIPSQINTLERLTAWCGYTLAFCNPTVTVVEAVNRTEKAAQAIIFQSADDVYRILIRACLPVDPSFMNDRTVKVWQQTEELANVVIPPAFKTN